MRADAGKRGQPRGVAISRRDHDAGRRPARRDAGARGEGGNDAVGVQGARALHARRGATGEGGVHGGDAREKIGGVEADDAVLDESLALG